MNDKMRAFGIPDFLEVSISHYLEQQQALKSPKKLAEMIQKLSDYFISKTSQETPWKSESASEAYAAYFLPLGVARALAVVQEASRLRFFEGLKGYVDFGSGPGTVSFALNSVFKQGNCIESSEQAISLHKKLSNNSTEWFRNIDEFKRAKSEQIHLNKTLLTMSYSLNELQRIPSWIYDFDALMVLEPSTQHDFVRLAELRALLVSKGYNIWAPCTHQEKCPLSGGRDWCHDRILFEKPYWWKDIEAHLPIKNNTITFSYLLARKDERPRIDEHNARLVGDQLEENGKTRQMVCRGPEREFLSWLHKEGDVPKLYRGDTIEIPKEVTKKGSEIRILRSYK